MNQKYNGWTNYETWLISIWYTDFIDEARQAWAQAPALAGPAQRLESAIDKLADIIKDVVLEMNPVIDNGLFLYLLITGLDNINWRELAEHEILNSIPEEQRT